MVEITPLGSTGLNVTRIGLGLAALGRPGYINLGHESDLSGRTDHSALEQHAQTVLDDAYSMGVRYFDTARSYGDGEAFLGRWLDKTSVTGAELTVSSKWGYRYVADWRVDADVHEVKEHNLDTLNQQYGESRERLGRYLDIYQIHSATIESGVLNNVQVLDRLAELRADGVLIGLSTSGPRQNETIRMAMAIERDGLPLFATVQATWNLLEPSAGEALAEVSDAGLGVIVKEAVANGRLTARDEKSSATLRRLFPGHHVDAVAIAAVLAQPWVDAVLSGAATTEQLASNLHALEVAPLLGAELPEMAEEPDEYWNRRSRLAWT